MRDNTSSYLVDFLSILCTTTILEKELRANLSMYRYPSINRTFMNRIFYKPDKFIASNPPDSLEFALINRISCPDAINRTYFGNQRVRFIEGHLYVPLYTAAVFTYMLGVQFLSTTVK